MKGPEAHVLAGADHHVIKDVDAKQAARWHVLTS
jgi:hypothetical protein